MMWLACPICRKLSRRAALCESCAIQLYERLAPGRRTLSEFHIDSLFSWDSEDRPALRWWIHALKNKDHPGFWSQPALWALSTFAWPPTPPLLVPIPNRRRNHALGFARALSQVTAWPIHLGLTEASSSQGLGAQKRRDRLQRRRRQFFWKGDFCNKSTPVIVIDDVVTTGATASAAFLALERPQQFSAWCLLDRSLSPLAAR